MLPDVYDITFNMMNVTSISLSERKKGSKDKHSYEQDFILFFPVFPELRR